MEVNCLLFAHIFECIAFICVTSHVQRGAWEFVFLLGTVWLSDEDFFTFKLLWTLCQGNHEKNVLLSKMETTAACSRNAKRLRATILHLPAILNKWFC